jgi:fumarate reductase (CoM/CoB) subunit B
MKTIRLTISRFDPELDDRPRLESHTVEINDGARVLHALQAVRDDIDLTLSYRHSCNVGQCGSCAVRVNGEPVLACKEEATDGMVVEPLRLPVEKDLVTDLVPLLESVASFAPRGESTAPGRAETESIKPLRHCLQCFSCVSVCPMLDVAEFAGPTVMRQKMRLALDPRDAGDRIPESVEAGLFHCTSCQACRIACPEEIATPALAIEKLRALAVERGFTFPKHLEFARLVRETGRSIELPGPRFLERVPGVVEPVTAARCTVALFTGCLYDLVMPETAFDAVEVMRRNGIRVVVPKDQVCCGSPLIRTGQTGLVGGLKERNIGIFAKLGVDAVVTLCAGCGTTLKNDYETPFEVLDITQLLVRQGIEPPARLPVRVTYHDPCHLLRGQGVREEPRALIRQAAELVEMPAWCCGSGGGVRAAFPEEAKALAIQRREEIEKTGADAVVSVCPFCEFHLREHTGRRIQNVCTLLLEGYREKDRQQVR